LEQTEIEKSKSSQSDYAMPSMTPQTIHLHQGDQVALQYLGAAVVLQWANLPDTARQSLLQQANSVGGLPPVTSLQKASKFTVPPWPRRSGAADLQSGLLTGRQRTVPSKSREISSSRTGTFSGSAIVSLLARICSVSSSLSLRVCSTVRLAARSRSRSGS
jgi:hypothetical protein